MSDYMLRVRLTKWDLERLEYLSKRRNLNKSEYIRHLISSEYIKKKKIT